MRSNLPVIFLAFANEYHEGRYLAKLVEEYKEVYAILGPVSANENPSESDQVVCELVVRQNATLADIIDVFQNPLYQGRISIFHYGGHADGYQLLLQGKDGESEAARGEGLVPLLSRRKSLKLVFLNGCSTQQLAQDLVERGVPAVIGTENSIADDIALMLSTRFYKGLAQGLTMAGAWEEAKDEVKAVKDPEKGYRGIKIKKGDAGRFPWDVAFKDDAAKEVFSKWNLPEVANQPLFNLPAPKKTQLPPSPFLFLKPYGPEQAEIFFGRSFYIRELYLKILEPSSPPIILLYGESGAGKSSLLDAGLRPRLETASAENNPDSLLFEVRYRRRDQDLGLVGTLAEMLSYHVLPAESDATEEKENEDDPNLEKIRRIESLARELEEDTADTFLSFIERYKAIRAFQGSEEHRQQLYQAGELREYAGAQLREAWRSIEAQSGRRLIVVLDQVEELFTRPNSKVDRELEDLLQVLQDIFGTPPGRGEAPLRGKIILGYREEFNAKIEARVKDYALPRSTVFLEQLKRKDILDIFQGLQSGIVAANYNIQLDERLPERVANDLLKGKESAAPGQSPVAPVLQLLLTKLWNKAYQKNSHQPAFTLDAYDQIQSQGKEMEEYFESQMQKVELLNAEAVESGLALDLLQFHVSDLGTSRRCHIEDIRRRYRHLPQAYEKQPDIVDQLVNWLKSPDIFLLNDNGRGYTSLPHDTLAPIIMREYNRSDKLGQRSARILDTKRPDFIRALQNNAVKNVRLDDNDLEVVEGGIKGMRALDEREHELLRISMEEREKRLRLRRILIQGGIVAGLFILLLSVFAGSLSISMTEQLGNAAVARAHEQSLIEQDQLKSNPLKAIQLAQFAYSNSETRRLDVVNNLYGLYQQNQELSYEDEFYEDFEEDPFAFVPETYEEEVVGPPLRMTLKPEARISSLDYQPSLGPLASLNDRTIQYWPQGDPENVVTINLGSELGIGNIKEVEVGFSGDGDHIQVQARFDRRPFYLLDGKLTIAPTLDIFPPSHSGYGEEAVSPVGYYDFFTGKFVDEFGLSYNREEFDQYAEDYFYYADYYDPEAGLIVKNDAAVVIPVDSLFSGRFKLWDERRNQFKQKAFNTLASSGWGVDLSLILNSLTEGKKEIPLRSTNLTRGAYNNNFVWPPDSLTGAPVGIFFEMDYLHYLTALSTDRFLLVKPDGETIIRDPDSIDIVQLLPPDSGIQDLAVSPNHRHLFAMTEDSVMIWDLEGARVRAYAHSNVRQYGFSTDGSRLFTLSPDRIWVWSEQNNGLLAYLQPPDDPPIALTRFNDLSDHLVIGLSEAATPPAQGGFLGFLRRKRPQESQIIYWNIDRGQETQSFVVTGGDLIDATVSENGKFAVALQPGKATVIPTSKEKISSREYYSKPIQARVSGKGEHRKVSRVFLSPAGKYIVRQSLHDRRIELFGRNGRKVNAYSFQNGFRQGFNGRIFTPDDHFLIGSKSNEVLFWHPDDGEVRAWADDFELTIEEKQAYGLDSFIDYIPGTKTNARWWAIAIILLSLIFILLYFSDFIIQFVQQKTYLEIAIYGMGFVLLSLAFVGVWAAGSDSLLWPDDQMAASVKKVALYGIVWATLAALGFGILRSWRLRKFQLLAVMGLLAICIVYGAAVFFQLETKQHQENLEKEYLRIIRADYQERPLFYDSLQLANSASALSPETVPKPLTPRQLKDLVKRHRIDVYQPALTREWTPVLFGLLILLVFSGLAAYPLYRSVQNYRSENRPAFYRWLLAPMSFLVSLFWILFGLFVEGNYGQDTIDLLSVVSILLLLVAGVRQARAYWRGRNYPALAVYGLPAALILLMLVVASGSFALAITATFILGRQYQQRGAPGKSFLWYSGCLFLTGGALIWTAFAGRWAMLEGILLAALLVLVFYGLRRVLHNIPGRYAVGRSRWPYWLATLGLWVAGLTASLFFAGEMLMISDLEDAYYEDPYYYEDYEEDLTYVEDPDTTWEEPGLPAGYPEDLPREDAPIWEEEPAEAPDTLLTEEPEEGLGETTASEPATSATPPPGQVDFSAPGLNNRQQLIVQLFDDEASKRDDARLDLSAYWKNDRALIPELIQYNYENPEVNEGIWNSLYLLEIQSDELLRSNRDLLIPYLDWTSRKGYGPTTVERIQELQARVDN